MKRILLYVIILAAAMIVPQQGMDLGTLKPVEVVFLDQNEETLIIRTDTGEWGAGATIPLALQNLKETTAGEIFLDTADYLIVSEQGKQVIGEIKPYLRKSVRVCAGSKELNLEEAARYLSAHKPPQTLGRTQQDTDIQTLTQIDDRIILQ